MKPLHLFLWLSVLLGCFLRLYGIWWGGGFFFHPDENNIATAVSQLSFTNFNPHFFAYGSLPIYVIYTIGLLTKLSFPFNDRVAFDTAIFVSRWISALLSIATVGLVYKIAKTYISKAGAALVSILSLFSVGFLQFSHFGTFEMWLTFLSLVFFWQVLNGLSKPTVLNFSLLGIIFGLLISVKVSTLALGIIFPFLFFVHIKQKRAKNRTGLLTISLLIAAVVFICVNPFVLLDFSDFINSMRYESSVATGMLPVFYTQGFINTIPGIYQLFYVFPFLLNPIVEIVGLFALGITIYHVYKKQTVFEALLLTFIAVLFFSQAFLFVKWTRYMVPLLPFIYLIIAHSIHKVTNKVLKKSIGVTVCLSTLVYAFLYAHVVLFTQDIRITAQEEMKKVVPQAASIFAEGYDLGIMPFQAYFPNLKVEESYDLDTNSSQRDRVLSLASKSQYILLPSQRIVRTRLFGTEFPKGSTLYHSYFDSKQYTLIYQTPCDFFCKLLYMGSPVTNVEETIAVFERPTVYIFKNNTL